MTKTCLVLMPFSDPDGANANYWNTFFDSLSRRIRCALSNYNCKRFYIGADVILPKLLVEIVAADLIVCDLTYMKPNVLFELGASLMLGKPTILLAQGLSALPSDISNYAFVKYSFDEQSGRLTFPSNGERDLFQQSLEFMTLQYESESFINTDSNLAKILRAVSNTLKHAIRLETENAILAPALKSLFDNLVAENARKLSDFIENDKAAVTVNVESPKILFDVLIALLKNLTRADRYDSITWRKHWTGGNYKDSERFLTEILSSADDLPAMRRVFLVGVKDHDNCASWLVDPQDQSAVKMYYKAIGALSHKVQNRVLFLPQALIDSVAGICHMGRITKNTSTIYVFSHYSDDGGALDSFRLARDWAFKWDYDDFWDVSFPLEDVDWSKEPVTIAPDVARFSTASGGISYEPQLARLLQRIGVAKSHRLIG